MIRILACLIAGGVALFGASADSFAVGGIVNAPVRDVWTAFTTKEGIESWMVTKTEFELRVGATWRTSYRRDSDLNDDAALHHTILSFDPGRMLSFRTIKPPSGFPFPNALAKAWTVVHFEPAPDGKTKVTIRMLGFNDDDESQKMRVFFERGNQMTLDALIKRFTPAAGVR